MTRRVVYSAHVFVTTPDRPTECRRCGRRTHVHIDPDALEDQLREWRQTYEPDGKQL